MCVCVFVSMNKKTVPRSIYVLYSCLCVMACMLHQWDEPATQISFISYAKHEN
jgi:hypothetical protein